jgi:hypothetical protein
LPCDMSSIVVDHFNREVWTKDSAFRDKINHVRYGWV